MYFKRLNISYDLQRLRDELIPLSYNPFTVNGNKLVDWPSCNLPRDSYANDVCMMIVDSFRTSLCVPPSALRFTPPHIVKRHIDDHHPESLFIIPLEDNFILEVEDEYYDFGAGLLNTKKFHRLVDVHSTIHIIRVSVNSSYQELVDTGIRKNLLKE